MTIQQFPCPQCGANLEFRPGTNQLECANCGYQEAVTPTEAPIEELDFQTHLHQLGDQADTHEVLTVQCQRCLAETSMEPHVTSSICPFCGSNLVMMGQSKRLIKPQSLLPFKVTREQAQDSFRQWLAGLWFAPSGLTSQARSDQSNLAGVYLPHWTYDCQVATRYTGQRGEYYYETESYTTTDDKGRPVTRTRQVQKTRWYPTSGEVANQFDDLVVVAGTSLPVTYIDLLEPWDLNYLVVYQDEYLSGFRSESYRVGLIDGFEAAKTKMAPRIETTIRTDIGGDVQQIASQNSTYHQITFKHILLPVWINAYRYQNEVYRFVVNARTGEIQGERPLSWFKIILAVLLDLLLAVVIGGGAFLVVGELEAAFFATGLVLLTGLGLIYSLASQGHRKP